MESTVIALDKSVPPPVVPPAMLAQPMALSLILSMPEPELEELLLEDDELEEELEEELELLLDEELEPWFMVPPQADNKTDAKTAEPSDIKHLLFIKFFISVPQKCFCVKENVLQNHLLDYYCLGRVGFRNPIN